MLRRSLLKKKMNYKLIKRGMAIMQLCVLVGMSTLTLYAEQCDDRANEKVQNEFVVSYNQQIMENVDIEYMIPREVENEYIKLVEMYYESGKCLDISIEDFEELYNSNSLDTIEEYVIEQESVKLNEEAVSLATLYSARSSSSSSGTSTYYYDTGTSCPSRCSYSRYALLNNLRKGDYIYEAKGGYGITGHSLIVEGKFYDAKSKRYYIRVIEAISSGVVRSVFDDTRLDEKEAYLKRPYSTEEQRAEAVEFAVNQLGKTYSLDLKKDTSKDEKDWYCSELVWAAFKNQGVDLEKPMGIDEPGVTPRDISISSACLCLSKYK